jgi:hypothetical protein
MQAISDIDFHGFIAKKNRTREKTYVTESRLDSVIVGTVIHNLNGTCLRDLQPMEVTNMVRNRATKMLPTSSSADTIGGYLNGFMTTRSQKRNLDPVVNIYPIKSSV